MGTAKTLDDRLDGSDLLARIKDAVSSVDQEAAVILYGSRATGQASPGSDWDILVLSDRQPLRESRQAIRSRLYEIEWATGEVISAVIKSREEWNLPLLNHSPYHRNIEREGIQL